MKFWVLWGVGFAIAIATGITIAKISHDTYNNNKSVQILIKLLVAISVCLTGGIFIGKWIGFWINSNVWSYYNSMPVSIFLVLGISVLTIFLAGLTYWVGFNLVLNLSIYFDGDEELFYKKLFVSVFIFSIIGWSILICRYNLNIKTTTETVTESKEERNILYIGNIPIQNVSGEIYGSRYHISGEITTSDEIPYWYLNQNGDGVYDTAESTSSKIKFIEEGEVSRVEIIIYATQKIIRNNNNGTEKISTIKKWKEYTFFVPKYIMEHH